MSTRTVKSLHKSGRISRVKSRKAIREIQESPEYRILVATPTGKITRKTTATGKGLVRFRVVNFNKSSTRSKSD